jgi:hypothetical protein
MRLSTRSILAGILLTIFSLSSMGPAGVYMLTTLFTHLHGHDHSIHHQADGGIVLAHAGPVAEAGLGVASGNHVMPGGEREAALRTTPTLIHALAIVVIALLQPLDRVGIPVADQQTRSASSGPPLFLKHQILLI